MGNTDPIPIDTTAMGKKQYEDNNNNNTNTENVYHIELNFIW